MEYRILVVTEVEVGTVKILVSDVVNDEKLIKMCCTNNDIFLSPIQAFQNVTRIETKITFNLFWGNYCNCNGIVCVMNRCSEKLFKNLLKSIKIENL